eukprot:254402_1
MVSPTLLLLTISTITCIVYSTPLICNETICNFTICDDETNCNNNEYICTDMVSNCSLQCNSNCNNITIISSALYTNIMCNEYNSCDTMFISILNPNNKLNFECKQLSSCTNINIECHSDAICEGIKMEYMYDQISTKTKTTIISVTIFWLTTCIGISIYIRITKNNTITENINNQKDKHKLLNINKIINESSSAEGHMTSDTITVKFANNKSYEGIKSTKLQPIPETNIIDSDITVTLLEIDESDSIHHI